jgi:hypothetical protein
MYITYQSRFILEEVAENSQRETPTFYQNSLGMRNTAAVVGGKPIAVWSQSISGVGAINPLIDFHKHPWKERNIIMTINY